jgi:hypothetical protein
MSSRDDDRFRVRPGAPKNRQPKFVSQVLKEVSKAGGASVRKSGARPGARLGRGHVAARFAGRTTQPGSRRVAIKTRLVNLKQAGPRSTVTHLRYIEREGVGRDGEPGQAFGAATDSADLAAFEEWGREDRHQFRFIDPPEDAEQLDDLRRYTRHLMSRMEADLGTGLTHRAVADGERVSGTYRRNVQLASGRFAMLDDGTGFSLVPWRPVAEQRLGQQVSAIVRGSSITWELGRQRGR